MSTRTMAMGRKAQGVFLIYVLAAIMVLFLGILVYVWIEAKKANPIMLDEHGKPRAAAAATWRV